MFRRPWILPPVALLLACLVVLPACKKKPPAEEGGDPAPGPTAGPPAAVSSEHLLYAHLNVKAIRDSAIFNEMKQALAKEKEGTELWDKVEREASGEMGFKPTDLDSVTICATELPQRDPPKFVLILVSSKPFDKATAFRLDAKTKPDSRGFYKIGSKGLLHYPDDKTAVMLHPDLAQKYLEGYAKDRSSWPLTADLTKAASGHTLFAALNMQKLPRDDFKGPDAEEFGPLLAAKTVTLTADLKGKELTAAGRATFPDATAAGKAKDAIRKFLDMAVGEVDGALKSKTLSELTGLMPAVKEAQRALKDAKLEVSGSDLTLVGNYKADFDVPALVKDAAKQIHRVSLRVTAQNNLKQIGLALLNYHDTFQRLPILGVGAKGAPLRNATDKPLLSWRVAILPYIEQTALYNQFKHDEPWDSENNKKLIEKMPKIYASVAKEGKPGYTHLQMVVGPNAMQVPGGSLVASIPDGTSNTLAVVEAADPVIWTKPEDVMLTGKEQAKDLRKRFGGQLPNGFNAVLWDGSVRFIPDSISDRTLSLIINPRDGEPLPNDW